jgi:hypothetical protein
MMTARSVQTMRLSGGSYPDSWLRPTVDFILKTQRPSGEIPWFEGGHTDPWDHTEAAMALSIAGEIDAAERAYLWLSDTQLVDGSWWACYREGQPDRSVERRETNYIAYIATGVWHHFLIAQDALFLERLFPVVVRALEFVLRYQGPEGEIDWAVDSVGAPLGDALVTGCSSIYKSLECGILIADQLGQKRDHWENARSRLGEALRHKPARFDRTWESKSRYAMDWFYPILTGVVEGEAAQQRLSSRWSEFVEPGIGCRCENHQPWATVAESCELTLALLAAGQREEATELFSWLAQWRDNDGAWWTGYQFAERTLWPLEKPTWTAGAVLLAADALTEHTAACRLFMGSTLNDSLETPPLEAGV